MAQNQSPRLDYNAPDPVETRLRSRHRVLGLVYCTLGACIIAGSLADWLGQPGVTYVMSSVATLAIVTLFIGRRLRGS